MRVSVTKRREGGEEQDDVDREKSLDLGRP